MQEDGEPETAEEREAPFRYSPQPPQSPRRVLSKNWEVECDRCYGRGCTIDEDDPIERYCDCEAGKWRRLSD